MPTYFWAGVLVTVGLAVAACSGGDDTVAAETPPPTPSVAVIPTPLPTPTATAPPAPTPTPTPSPTATSTPSPTPEPTVPPWLDRAEALISVFENSTTQLQYGYIEALGDGRGYTAGRAGFTTGTADLVVVVRAYVEAVPDSPLVDFVPVLDDLAARFDGSLAGLEGFPEVWQAAAGDPVMRVIQDEVARELYYWPSHAIADGLGLQLPISRAALYGTAIQHGVGTDADGLPAIVDEATEAVGSTPAGGADERVWLEAFLRARKLHLEFAATPATREVWARSAGRVDTWLDLLAREVVAFDAPFTATAFGGVYNVP